MKNLDKMKSLLESGEVDALLLTSEVNRHYAARYNIAEGVALVCRNNAYYFTDSRYIEAAEKNLPDFTVRMVDREHPYTKLLNEAIEAETVKTLGFEENYLTYNEYTSYNTKLNVVLKPYQEKISAFRGSKEDWELELMRKAQEITDLTFSQMCEIVKPGMTEKEVTAELIYRLYKNGGEGLSFQPIVVSGPNTSMPHGVPGERVLQYGDFVTMDFGCLYKGYCSDMTRTVALGFVTEEMASPARTSTARRARSSPMRATASISATATATASASRSMRRPTPTSETTSRCLSARSAPQSRASTFRASLASASRM